MSEDDYLSPLAIELIERARVVMLGLPNMDAFLFKRFAYHREEIPWMKNLT